MVAELCNCSRGSFSLRPKNNPSQSQHCPSFSSQTPSGFRPWVSLPSCGKRSICTGKGAHMELHCLPSAMPPLCHIPDWDESRRLGTPGMGGLF